MLVLLYSIVIRDETCDMTTDDLYCAEAKDYERWSRRIYLVRCVYAVLLILIFIIYRMVPSWPVATLIPLCIGVFWIFDANNVKSEIKTYRTFVIAIASNMKEPVPKSLPEDQSVFKIMFLGLDVTPLYLGPMMIFLVLFFHSLPNRLMSDEFAQSERPLVRIVTKQAVNRVLRMEEFFHCCTNCYWWCLCSKDCPCRVKRSLPDESKVRDNRE